MNLASLPLISVVIPTYQMKGQGLSFLKRCLTSLQMQINIPPGTLEIIISDQSTDKTIENFCKAFGNNLHYYRIATGCGNAAHNLNAGIFRAKGQYLKILFQDDFLVEKDHLSSIIDVIQKKQPEIILSAAVHAINNLDFYNPMVPKPNQFFLFGKNTVSSPSVLTIKRDVAEGNAFDEYLLMLFDCDFYYRIFKKNLDIIILKNIRIANGIWSGQTQNHINRSQFTKEVRYLNRKYPESHMKLKLVEYIRDFKRDHPNAQLPFSDVLEPNFLQIIMEFGKFISGNGSRNP
jgi:glycosyltransferase involved in cell wall biosynthesis